uniref:Uncharacterized protein n=1 Tax=Amphimedon queenslandica TaxID=400682 RepID=A0A1X7UT22_AMPQE
MLKNCSKKLEELNEECTKLRKKCEAKGLELKMKDSALRDITNQNQCLKEKNELSKLKLGKLKDVNEQLRIKCLEYEVNNLSQSEESCSDTGSDTSEPSADDVEAMFQTLLVIINTLQN